MREATCEWRFGSLETCSSFGACWNRKRGVTIFVKVPGFLLQFGNPLEAMNGFFFRHVSKEGRSTHDRGTIDWLMVYQSVVRRVGIDPSNMEGEFLD